MKLKWDQQGEKLYESGCDRGVLYVQQGSGEYGNGIAWNGLTNVSESPSGAESSPIYADNKKYANLISNEEFGATIEAYTYPDEFMECDGTSEIAKGVYAGQQSRKNFALSYRTLIGNDVDGLEHGYKIHLVYGCTASPSEKAHGTINESPEAITFSWTVSTTPVEIDGMKPTAHVIIDSTKVDAEKLKQLEDKLYGTSSEEASLLLPREIISIVGASSVETGSNPVA